MKATLSQKILLSAMMTGLTLGSTQVLAHTGHMVDEAVHGFLHAEHIVALAALGVVAYVVHVIRNK